jgi:hypothetical protein
MTADQAERNQLRRLNRQLAKEGRTIHKSRGLKARADLGDYYCVDDHTNTIDAMHIDLAVWEKDDH